MINPWVRLTARLGSVALFFMERAQIQWDLPKFWSSWKTISDSSNVDARSLAASRFQNTKTWSEPKHLVNGQLLLNKLILCNRFSLVAFFCYIRSDSGRSANTVRFWSSLASVWTWGQGDAGDKGRRGLGLRMKSMATVAVSPCPPNPKTPASIQHKGRFLSEPYCL